MGNTATSTLAYRTEQRPLVLIQNRTLHLPARWKRALPALLILTADTLGLLMAQALAFVLFQIVGMAPTAGVWSSSLLATLLFLGGYRMANLYPGIIYHPVEELRKLTTVTSLVGCVIIGTLLVFESTSVAFQGYLALSVLLALATVPLARTAFRKRFASTSWWGYPAVIIGADRPGQEVLQRLKDNPEFGLRPVAFVDENPLQPSSPDVPLFSPLSQANTLALQYRIPYVILARPDLKGNELTQFIETYTRYFPHVMVIPDIPEFSNLWRTTRDLHGLFGLTFQQPQQQTHALRVKRVFDLLLASFLLLVLSPLLLLIALAVKLSSRGPILYTQYRLGKDGKCFRVLKFRSMYTDAAEKLVELLNRDPEARKEYQTYKKLKNDPRVTPVGRFLRRYSLDELPQLFNVLRGELSLVGPRAYMPEELEDMENLDRQILSVHPGITGLWQVSGRNQLTFKTRLLMDVYYVKNWSIWLDIYLLARTVPVVLTGRGAH